MHKGIWGPKRSPLIFITKSRSLPFDRERGTTMTYFYTALVTILVLCVPLSLPCVSLKKQSHSSQESSQSPAGVRRACSTSAAERDPVLHGGIFFSLFVYCILGLSSPLPSKLLFLWPDAGFSLWQWMAGGPPGASGRLVGQSARTGAGGSARRRPPRTEARTAMVWSCNPRTALMGSACRVSLCQPRTHWGDVRFNHLELLAGNMRNEKLFQQQKLQ